MMVNKLTRGMGLGGAVVGIALLLAFLHPAFAAPSPFGLSWQIVVLAGAALYGAAAFGLMRGASAGSRRLLKFAGLGLVVFSAFSIFVLPAMTVVPPGGGGLGAPTAVLTAAEGTCFNFPDFSTDGDCATTNAEIAINSHALIVLLDVIGESDPGTLAPDSWAVSFTLRCTASCDYEVNGVAFQTPYHARIIGLSGWVILGNTSDIQIYERNADGTWQIAWTDVAGNTIVGFEDGGSMNSFGDGESGTFTFTMYMNENGIPDGVPDAGEKYTRTAIVNIFSPRGGTSFNVQVDLVLTVNT